MAIRSDRIDIVPYKELIRIVSGHQIRLSSSAAEGARWGVGYLVRVASVFGPRVNRFNAPGYFNLDPGIPWTVCPPENRMGQASPGNHNLDKWRPPPHR